MKVLLSHSGKQHSYHVAKALNSLGYLEKFYTSSYITNKKIQDFLIKNKNTYWTRRFLTGLDGGLINSNWHLEFNEIILRKLFGKNKFTNKSVRMRDISFDQKVSKLIRKHKADTFWGFQGSCLESIKAANDLEKRTICEQTAPYYKAVKEIISEESLLSPEWKDSMEDICFPSQYEQRLIEEPDLAHSVIVASDFSKKTLVNFGINENKIIKLHLGCDIENISFTKKTSSFGSRPLKLLYVGRISQSKGIKYLLEALTNFKNSEVSLDLIGNLIGSGNAFKKIKGNHQHLSSISQELLYKTYEKYDALVLPTLYDGFGLVIIEAMAAGLPVITTENSFGPELIVNGKNGYIVPIRDSNALTNSISNLLNTTKDEFQKMRLCSRETAENFNWMIYRNKLKNFIQS